MVLQERLATALGQLRRLGDETHWLGIAGTSQAQMQFVMWVGNHPGCRLQHISAGLGLSAPTVSVSVQRLEQAGLIQRAPDEHDQRAINLVLTPRGQELYTKATSNHERNVKALLDRLKPSEQRQLVDLLERCLNDVVAVPQTLPAEASPASAEVAVAADVMEEPIVPPGPKQLDFFGG
ncbi:MAG: MarR family winged helix-turn-helix transcriptional regulator [Anaerolineae bacterium]